MPRASEGGLLWSHNEDCELPGDTRYAEECIGPANFGGADHTLLDVSASRSHPVESGAFLDMFTEERHDVSELLGIGSAAPFALGH